MEYLKNIRPYTPAVLEELIQVQKGQITSMALSQVDNVQISLFALSAEEMISEEAYWGDTLYYVLLGEIAIEAKGDRYKLSAGEILAIPAQDEHALVAGYDSKLLQITLNK